MPKSRHPKPKRMNDLENLTIICASCNRAKGEFTGYEFKSLLDCAFFISKETQDILTKRLRAASMMFKRRW